MKRTLFMALLLTCSAALFASCGPTKNWNLSERCSKFLNQRYANARILDVDYDDGMVEVEIRHEKKNKEVLFTNSCEWVSTSWDVAQRNVPAVVMKALQKKYPNARIDDIDFIEMPRGSYYRFEIERRGQQDEYVYITPQGVITEVRVYHK